MLHLNPVAADVPFTPGGLILSTNVQAALAEVDSEKAPLASPAFTGTPTVPTGATSLNNTQAASTAWVKSGGLKFDPTAYSSSVTVTSTPYTLSSSNVGRNIYVEPSTPQQIVAINLPAASSVPAGLGFQFICATECNIIRNGSDVVKECWGQSPTTRLWTHPGSVHFLISNGSNAWFALSADGPMGFDADPVSNGYVCFPNKVMINWGSWTASGTIGNPIAVTFANSFVSVYSMGMCSNNPNTTTCAVWFDTLTSSGFNGRCSIASVTPRYIATGTWA